MADSLILKGVKDIRKHTGTEMQLVNPRRGGNTHPVARWWAKGVSTVYAACTVFDVTTSGDPVKLVIATGRGESSTVRIDHVGDGTFEFSAINEVQRAAVFDSTWNLIRHYVFPAIQGGVIDVVEVIAELSLTSITGVSIIGSNTAVDGESRSYTANALGSDPGPFQYAWTVTGGSIVGNNNTKDITVDWDSTGANSVACQILTSSTSFDGDTSNNLTTKNVTVTASFSTRVANADLSVAVTVADTGNGDKYQIDGVEQDALIANVGATIHFDLSDASVSGHPFKIYTDSTKTTEVTVGIEQDGTDLLFTPPIAGSFSYQCSAHAGMGGDITVS